MSQHTALETWEGRPVDDWRQSWQLPQLQVLAVTGSTNDDGRVLAESGAPSGTTVIAEQQTQGRGRGGRSWVGTPGQSLHISTVLRPPETRFSCLSAVPVRVGLIAIHALNEHAGVRARLKWPNDIQLSDRKLGGILCESVLGDNPFLVIGVGVNIGQRISDFPAELQTTATSVYAHTGRTIERSRLAGGITRGLLQQALRIAEPFDETELAELNALDALRSHEVEIDGQRAGRAMGINAAGALLVQYDNQIREIHGGTVRLASAFS